jgi:hypothetical protein
MPGGRARHALLVVLSLNKAEGWMLLLLLGAPKAAIAAWS